MKQAKAFKQLSANFLILFRTNVRTRLLNPNLFILLFSVLVDVGVKTMHEYTRCVYKYTWNVIYEMGNFHQDILIKRFKACVSAYVCVDTDVGACMCLYLFKL